MNRFLSRHADSVGIVEAVGEHHMLDVFQARRFLATLLNHSDEYTRTLTLEADANLKHLTHFERDNLVDANKFDLEDLEARDAPKEYAPCERMDAMFCQET